MARMRVPMHVPVVLTSAEVARLLAALTSHKHRALVMLAYGAGLRVSEVCKLRVDDIDPKRMLLHVRHSASHATTRLETARRRLGPHAAPAARPVRRVDAADLLLRIAGIDLHRCPACHTPALVRTALPEPRARDPPGAA